MPSVDVAVDLGRGLRLPTPVVMASGTFAYGFDAPLVDRDALGAIVTKGTTLRPRHGNPPTRIAETPAGMLNAIGLQNPGVDVVRREYAPRWAAWTQPVIVNVAGDRIDEYVEIARRLDGVPGIAGLELNISCPNVDGGLQFGLDRRLAGELTAAVRAATSQHLMVKLTPNVTNLVEIARAVADAGADSLSAINTYVGMAIDARRRRPVLANVVGGLSGPAIKPLALRAVWEVAGAVSIPVIGIGGISTAEDAIEFLLAGARAVQLGTVNYVRPQAAREVLDGIARYALAHGFTDLRPFPLRALRPNRVPAHADAAAAFESSGAHLRGHFEYTSGRHGADYLEKFRILENPRATQELAAMIAARFRPLNVQLVAGPTMGGLVLAYEVARQLDVGAVYAERGPDGGRVLRRGFHIPPGTRVLLVDDVVTTGGSIRAMQACIASASGEVIGIGVLGDRTNGAAVRDLPFYACLRVDYPSYAPGECPLCEAGVPLTLARGSRPNPAVV